MNWWKTASKVVKSLGFIAAVGALNALSGGELVAAVAPLGVYAPIAIIALQGALTAALDYLRHRNDG